MAGKAEATDPTASPMGGVPNPMAMMTQVSHIQTGVADGTKEGQKQFNILLERVGVLTCVARTGKAVKAVEAQVAKNADRAMIGQVRLMLNKFGVKIKASIHSAGEPAWTVAMTEGLSG